MAMLEKGASASIFQDSFEPAGGGSPVGGPPAAVRVLTKLAYGARAGEVAAFNALGATDAARLSAWVNQQLAPRSGTLREYDGTGLPRSSRKTGVASKG